MAGVGVSGQGVPVEARGRMPRDELALSVIFAATGVGMALPGAVLPALMHEWALRDGGAGLLFFLAWLGSSTGALAAGRWRRSVVAGGCAAVAAALAAIALGIAELRFVEMFVYGLGLGAAMTAISMIQAERHARESAWEMNRLNMIWALGAVACPLLAEHSLRVASAGAIAGALATVFALLTAWALRGALNEARGGAQNEARRQTVWPPSAKLPRWTALWPVPLMLLAFLPTGIESTMGGWVTEYARREHQSIRTAVLAASLFWGGLLVSRGLGATRFLAWRTEPRLLAQSAWTILVGVLMLVLLPDRAGILCGNALVGLGLGPVYPLALALALRRREHPGIFWIAGLGSALLPWMTGVASLAGNSLRVGMAVPMAAAAVLVACSLAVGRGVGFSTELGTE